MRIMNQFCQLNAKFFLLIYLLNNGLSSSVKNVTAFPLCPALPVRPKRNQTIKKTPTFGRNGTFKNHIYKSLDFHSTKNLSMLKGLVVVLREVSRERGGAHDSPILWIYSTELVGKS